jgi:hypothetical protein
MDFEDPFEDKNLHLEIALHFGHKEQILQSM